MASVFPFVAVVAQAGLPMMSSYYRLVVDVVAQKLEIVRDARLKGKTAKEATALVGRSGGTLYHHHQVAGS